MLSRPLGVLLALTLGSAALASDQTAGVRGPIRLSVPSELQCAPLSSPEKQAGPGKSSSAGRRVPVGASTAVYPQYLWPLAKDLGNGLLLANYVDDDSTPAVHDYMGGTQAYDAHQGTDFTFYNFRLSDRGEPIRAATSGTVTYMHDGSVFDRNCGFAPDEGNWLWLANGDGTYSSYYHLRTNSMTVQIGDVVPAGTVLGLVGSSGYSTQPHLHFETGDFFSGPYKPRDPWHGTNNPKPSLWKLQEGYVGSSHFWVADMGVFNESVSFGDAYYSGYCAFINRLQEPARFGLNEPSLYVWFQYQAQVGDIYTMEVRKPNSAVYWTVTDTLHQRNNWDWLYYIFPFQVYVTPADSGAWTARILSGGAVRKQTQFQVGATTAFGTRFYPRAGRSLRINGVVQKDTLRVSARGGPVTYSLLNAPGFVSLGDSIVTVAAASTQVSRWVNFQAVAQDGAGRRDTMWYNVVDFSKPQNAPAALAESSIPPAVRLLQNRPNPFTGSTTLRYAVARQGRVRLEILDASGRRIQLLVDEVEAAGERAVAWDGRMKNGRRAPPGVYFCRLTEAGVELSRKMLRF